MGNGFQKVRYRDGLGNIALAAALQDAFGWAGRLSRIELRLRDGVPHRAFAERVRATLPAGVVIDRPDATLRATSSISRSYRINLNVLALVALFTGSLLVFTTQALGVVRRRSQFALLRTLGVTRGRLDKLAAETADSETLKGEFVVVVAPPAEDAAEPSDAMIEQQLDKALKLESFRDAVRSVAEVLNVSRARVYELGLKLKRD